MTKEEMQIRIDKNGQRYFQPKDICNYYGICRTAAHTLIREFRTNPKYKNSYLALSHNLKLVHIKDFDEFLHTKSRNYLRT